MRYYIVVGVVLVSALGFAFWLQSAPAAPVRRSPAASGEYGNLKIP